MPDADGDTVGRTDRAGALVVCIGNSLVGDDAAGCAVFDALSELPAPPSGVRLYSLGLGGIALLDVVAGEELLIAVDAVSFGAPAGTIHVLDWDRIPQARGQAVSVHGIGLREAVEVGTMICPERMPRRVLLIGIEGTAFEGLGSPMTREVRDAVPVAAKIIQEILARPDKGLEWRNHESETS